MIDADTLESVRPMICKLASQMARNNLDVRSLDGRDLVQEGLLAIIRHGDKFRAERGKFSTFCYTVARNAMRDVIKLALRQRPKFTVRMTPILRENLVEDFKPRKSRKYDPSTRLEFLR